MRTITLTCAVLMGCGALLSARLLYAEAAAHENDLVRFAPPAEYFERLADIDPDNAAYWLGLALEANPRLTSAWIKSGLAAERAHRLDEAERDLLHASAVDHRYLPAWTLANFYFRQNQHSQFWIWARRSAALTYDDFRPLLALAYAVEPDPLRVVEKLGRAPALLHADLDSLAVLGRLDQAQQVARLMFETSQADTPRLLALADLQIRAGHTLDALELWNAVAPRLDHTNVVANGDFAAAPTGVAFDWRLPQVEGLSSTWRPSRFQFSLSGAQPESFATLEQIVPLGQAGRYRLRFEYMTSGLSAPTGLAWALDNDPTATLIPAPSWTAGEALLLAGRVSATELRPGDLRLGKLRLLYRRPPGTVPAHGQIQLRNVHMEAI